MVKGVGKDLKEVHKITCKTCASILEYTKSEELEGKSTDYTGSTDTYDYIVCPECNERVVTWP